jgi:hypothetical protein
MIVAWILRILTDNHKLEQRNQSLEEEASIEGVRALAEFEDKIELPLRREMDALKEENRRLREALDAKDETQRSQIDQMTRDFKLLMNALTGEKERLTKEVAELHASKQELLRRIEALLNVVPELIGQIARLLGEKGLREMPSFLDELMESKSQDIRSLASRGWSTLFTLGKGQSKPYSS